MRETSPLTRTEILASFLLATFAALAIRYDALALPFYWDELGAYSKYAYTLLQNHFLLDHRLLPTYNTVHTPLYYLIIAAAAKLAGWSVPLVRWIGFAAAGLFISGAYVLARTWLNPFQAALAALTLLFSPVTLSQIGMAHPDLPMAALAAWSFALLSWRRRKSAAAVFMLGTMTNGTLLALFPAYALLICLQFREDLGLSDAKAVLRRSWQPILRFAAPAAVAVAAWELYMHAIDGIWILPARERGNFYTIEYGAFFTVKRIAHRVLQVFLWDGRYTLTAAVAGVTFLGWHRRERPAPLVAALAAVPVLGALFLGFFGTTHQRYFMDVLPALHVLGAAAFFRLARGAGSAKGADALAPAALVILAFLGYVTWRGPSDHYASIEYRAGYREQVQLLEHVAEALSHDATHPQILTAWPVTDALRLPFAGYVSEPLDVLGIDEERAGTAPLTELVKKPSVLVLLRGEGLQVFPDEAVLRARIFTDHCDQDQVGPFVAMLCRAR